jgi:hypothetical protein
MSFTTRTSNGEILTGKHWQKNLSYFDNLPFYSNIPRMDDIAESLVGALKEDDLTRYCNTLLVVRYVYFPFKGNLKSLIEIWEGSG